MHFVEGGRRAGERDHQQSRDITVLPLPQDLRAHLVEDHREWLPRRGALPPAVLGLVEERDLVVHLVEGGRRAGERDHQQSRDIAVLPLSPDPRAYLVEDRDQPSRRCLGRPPRRGA